MHVLKWLTGILAGLIAVFVLLIVGLTVFIDPNDYKPQIIALVEKQTGREFELNGDVSWMFFPSIGFEIGQARLSQPDGFSVQEPFVAFEYANLSLKLLPLLRKSIQIDDIEINGLQAYLIVQADGNNNWQFSETTADPATPDPSSDTGLQDFSVGSINIRDARMRYQDASAEPVTDITIDPFNLQLGALSSGQPVGLSASFTLVLDGEQRLTVNGQTNGEIIANWDAEQYQAQPIEVLLELQGDTIPGGSQTIEAFAKVEADLQQATATLTDLTLSIAPMRLLASVAVTGLNTDNQALTGTISSNTFSLRQLIQNLGQTVPASADDALQTVELNAEFSMGPNRLQVQPVTMTLDDSTIEAQLDITDLENADTQFSVTIDQLNLDNYLPPESVDEAETDKATSDDVIALPVDTLRDTRLQGDINIGQLQMLNLQMRSVEIGLRSRDGIATLRPLNLHMYEGSLMGSAGLNVQQDTPRYSANLTINDMASQPLLNDLAESNVLAGRLATDLEVQTSGNTKRQITQNMNGRLNAEFNDGRLIGYNLDEIIRQARARLRGRDYVREDDREETAFGNLTVRGPINSGVFNNEQFLMIADHYRLEGRGRVNLQSYVLSDYQLQLGYRDNEDDTRFKNIYLKVTNTLMEPKVNIDWSRIGDIVEDSIRAEVAEETDKLATELEEKRRAEEARLQRKIEKETQRAGRKLEEGLKKLFD